MPEDISPLHSVFLSAADIRHALDVKCLVQRSCELVAATQREIAEVYALMIASQAAIERSRARLARSTPQHQTSRYLGLYP